MRPALMAGRVKNLGSDPDFARAIPSASMLHEIEGLTPVEPRSGITSSYLYFFANSSVTLLSKSMSCPTAVNVVPHDK